MNKLNNLNVNYFKIRKKHLGPHKMSSRAACLRPLPLKRNTRSAPLAVRTSDRGSDQSQLLAICAFIDLTKKPLPSSFLIEAFWLSTFTSGTFIWCSSLWLSRIPCSGTCVTTTNQSACTPTFSSIRIDTKLIAKHKCVNNNAQYLQTNPLTFISWGPLQ